MEQPIVQPPAGSGVTEPHTGGGAAGAPEPIIEARKLVYTELCKGHHAIADFRAKLLALLPSASGAAAFLLVNKLGEGKSQSQLVGIGVFGLAVTFGLFMYEVRGIQDCTLLRERAEALEENLGVSVAESQFHRDPARFGGLANEVGAGWIVYTAVLLSWVYVAGTGADVEWDWWPAALVIVYFVILALSPPLKRLRAWARRAAVHIIPGSWTTV
jgi:hypothetical protein